MNWRSFADLTAAEAWTLFAALICVVVVVLLAAVTVVGWAVRFL